MYLTHDEYKKLGGKLDESTFSFFQVKAEKKLDFLTMNRLKRLTRIPDEVKELLVEFIDMLPQYNTARDASVTSYSNGIESFSYNGEDVERTITNKFWAMCKEYLCMYPELIRRGN